MYLRLVLDSLGDDGHVELVPGPMIISVMREPSSPLPMLVTKERSILRRSSGSRSRIGEDEAGAEVIDRDRRSERLERMQLSSTSAALVMATDSVISSSTSRGGTPVSPGGLGDVVDEVIGLELHDGDVDGHAQVGPAGIEQATQGAQGGAHHPAPHTVDQARLLGERNEPVRRMKSPLSSRQRRHFEPKGLRVRRSTTWGW